MENMTKQAGTTVAAFCVERALGGMRGGIAGLAVEPIVWAVSGEGPDAGDAFIYGVGAVGAFAGSLLALPAMVTGFIKAAVDDHTAALVASARLDEPEAVRNGILSVAEYSFAASGGHIQAMTIASFGGVAWRHPNGVYLFMRDAAEHLVCDYVPRRFTRIYRPIIPLRKNGDRVYWTSDRP